MISDPNPGGNEPPDPTARAILALLGTLALVVAGGATLHGGDDGGEGPDALQRFATALLTLAAAVLWFALHSN